jgi:hypothetical protein
MFVRRTFTALAKYCSRNENSFNFMIMLGFFTSTAMQRLFAMQTMMPGTAKVIGCFTLAIKPNMPEVNVSVLYIILLAKPINLLIDVQRDHL